MNHHPTPPLSTEGEATKMLTCRELAASFAYLPATYKDIDAARSYALARDESLLPLVRAFEKEIDVLTIVCEDIRILRLEMMRTYREATHGTTRTAWSTLDDADIEENFPHMAAMVNWQLSVPCILKKGNHEPSSAKLTAGTRAAKKERERLDSIYREAAAWWNSEGQKAVTQ